MATLLDMVNRIVSETTRSDLGLSGAPRVRAAITDAIKQYQGQRFRFSDVDPDVIPTFPTVAQQSVYSFSANPNIQTIYFIDYLQVLIGNVWQDLSRRYPIELHQDIQPNGQASGYPSEYAYEGNKLIFYPVPDTVYQVRLGGHVLLAAPANDTDNANAWMNEAEIMIRSRAKYELAVHVLRNPTMARAMTPYPTHQQDGGLPGAAWAAWSQLKGETNKIKGRGSVVPMAW